MINQTDAEIREPLEAAGDWIATAHDMLATPIATRGPWFVANLRVCLVKAQAALIT